MNIFQKRKFESFFHVFALNCDILFIWKFSGLVHSSPWVIMKKLLQTINKYVNRFILRSQTVHFFKEIYFCKKKNPLLKSLKKTHENISRFYVFFNLNLFFFVRITIWIGQFWTMSSEMSKAFCNFCVYDPYYRHSDFIWTSITLNFLWVVLPNTLPRLYFYFFEFFYSNSTFTEETDAE